MYITTYTQRYISAPRYLYQKELSIIFLHPTNHATRSRFIARLMPVIAPARTKNSMPFARRETRKNAANKKVNYSAESAGDVIKKVDVFMDIATTKHGTIGSSFAGAVNSMLQWDWQEAVHHGKNDKLTIDPHGIHQNRSQLNCVYRESISAVMYAMYISMRAAPSALMRKYQSLFGFSEHFSRRLFITLGAARFCWYVRDVQFVSMRGSHFSSAWTHFHAWLGGRLIGASSIRAAARLQLRVHIIYADRLTECILSGLKSAIKNAKQYAVSWISKKSASIKLIPQNLFNF